MGKSKSRPKKGESKPKRGGDKPKKGSDKPKKGGEKSPKKEGEKSPRTERKLNVDTVPEAPKKKKNTRSETPPARKIGVVAITDKIISLAKQEEELRAEREHVTDRDLSILFNMLQEFLQKRTSGAAQVVQLRDAQTRRMVEKVFGEVQRLMIKNPGHSLEMNRKEYVQEKLQELFRLTTNKDLEEENFQYIAKGLFGTVRKNGYKCSGFWTDAWTISVPDIREPDEGKSKKKKK